MSRSRIIPWVVGGAFVTVLILQRIVAGITGAAPGLQPWHCDFANLWAAGHFVAAHDWRELYDVSDFTARQHAMFGPVGRRVFSYPPTVFAVTQMVAAVPYRIALLAWLGGTATVFLLAARRWWPASAGPAWLALLTPAALLNVNFGQSGFLFGALWLVIFAQVERRPWLAGLMVAGFTAKPQLAILIPVVLILTGQWRAVAAAALGSIAWIAASVVCYGIEPWRQFLGSAVPRQAGFVDGGDAFIVNLSSSTATMVHQWTGSWVLAWGAHAAVAAWALWIIVAAIRDRAPLRSVAMLAATATFVVLPYGLAYDLTVPAIAAWAIIADPLSDQRERWLAMVGFVAPQLAPLIGIVAAPTLPIAVVALLYAQHRRRTVPRRSAGTGSAVAPAQQAQA